MKEVMELSMGNPGAMNCVLALLDHNKGSEIIEKVKEYEIKGTDLYIFCSDICNNDYNLMHHICNTAPKDLLIKASSKQDYSGRESLKKYIESFKN